MIEEGGSVREVPWTGFDRRASALAISRAGETLAFGGRDGLLGVWDLNKRALVRQWQGHPAAVRALAFSRDGTMLASSAEDRTVKLWQPISATVPHAVAGYRSMVNALAFAPGPEALLAGGGEDGKIVFWDVKLRKPVRTLGGHRGAVRALAFSPDGSMLVSGGDGGVLVWNAKTGKQLRILHRNSQEWLEGRRPAQGRPPGYGSSDITVVSIRFSADGRLVACGGTNDTAIIWDTRTWGRRTYRIIGGRQEPGAM